MNGRNENDDDDMTLEEVNRQQDIQNESNSYSNQAQVEDIEKMNGVDVQTDKYESEKKGLSIEIEMEPECDLSTCAGTIMHTTEILITQWTKNKVIEGFYDLNGGIMNDEYDDLDNWAMEPRIIKKRNMFQWKQYWKCTQTHQRMHFVNMKRSVVIVIM